MKVKITVDIEGTDGETVAEATMIEVNVPEFEEFTGPEKFGEVFDTYERAVIKARNAAIEAATERYLSELAKKNAVGGTGTRNNRKAEELCDRC
jgi:hypothetical protein